MCNPLPLLTGRGIDYAYDYNYDYEPAPDTSQLSDE